MTDRTTHGREIARAVTGIDLFDHAKFRPQRDPDEFREEVQSLDRFVLVPYAYL